MFFASPRDSLSLSVDQLLSIMSTELPFLLISNSMGSVLFAMLFALFFFATPSMRRQPIFILNVVAIFLGLAHALLWMFYAVRVFGQGIVFQPRIIIAATVLSCITPVVVDCILLLRLWAVFPRHYTPLWTWCIVVGVPILIKVGRLATLAYYIVLAVQRIGSGVSSLPVADLTASMFKIFPYVQIEWIAKLIDDLFCSGPFLWRLYKDGLFASRAPFTSRLQQLFWISTYNFVFPVLLNIIQIVVCMTSDNYLPALCLAQVDLYLTIVGLVFATVWAAEARWEDAQEKGTEVPLDHVPPSFASWFSPFSLHSGAGVGR